MKTDNYVEFTGLMPKELQKAKKPIYGRITKISKSGSLITVKPRNRTYEVTVDEADLTEVPYEKFHKKHTGKRKPTIKKGDRKTSVPRSKVAEAVKKAAAAKPVREVVVKGEGPVKVVSKDFPKIVEEKIAKAEAKADQPEKKPIFEQIREDEKAVAAVCDKPKACPTKDQLIDDHEGSGGVIAWVAGIIIVTAAIAAYFIFF